MASFLVMTRPKVSCSADTCLWGFSVEDCCLVNFQNTLKKVSYMLICVFPSWSQPVFCFYLILGIFLLFCLCYKIMRSSVDYFTESLIKRVKQEFGYW